MFLRNSGFSEAHKTRKNMIALLFYIIRAFVSMHDIDITEQY